MISVYRNWEPLTASKRIHWSFRSIVPATVDEGTATTRTCPWTVRRWLEHSGNTWTAWRRGDEQVAWATGAIARTSRTAAKARRGLARSRWTGRRNGRSVAGGDVAWTWGLACRSSTTWRSPTARHTAAWPASRSIPAPPPASHDTGTPATAQQWHEGDNWLIELWFYFPLDTKWSHLGDISTSQSLGLVWKKTKPNTTNARIHQSKEMYDNIK